MHILSSHSTLQAKETFDQGYFFEANNISLESLNGCSGYSFFQVHYQLLALKARYDYECYLQRLYRLIALNKCRSKALSVWTERISRKQGYTKIYYYPPSCSRLLGLGLKAREADLFISPETLTNSLAELLVNGEGILAKDQMIEMLPSLLRTEESLKVSILDENIVRILLKLQQEKKQANSLAIGLPRHFGRPRELDDDQISTIRCCFDSKYYEQYYHQTSEPTYKNETRESENRSPFYYFISKGRLNDHSPCEFFCYSYYINRYWKSIPAEEDAYHYYLTNGWRQGHSPSRRFSHSLLKKLTDNLEGDDIHGPVGKIIKRNYPASVILNEMAERLSPIKGIYHDDCKLDDDGRDKVKSLISQSPSVHAFYLTQFHPIPENNINWGKGFTEWTNTTKTIPYFLGHHQPKLPLEGFYDLRVEENLCVQSETASNYGIDCFCFYFYWFQGRKVLEKPLNSFLAKASGNNSFSLLWANENWTRNWDGQDSEIIISQRYEEEDCILFCKDICFYIIHPNYYRSNGKPVLYIYRPSSIPNAYEWIDQIRKYFKENYGLELVIGIVQYLPHDKLPQLYGADLILQFPPNGFKGMALTTPPPKMQRTTSDDYLVLNYQSMIDENQSLEYPGEVVRTSFPAWDSSPRKKNGWATFTGASPDTFQTWLTNNLRSASLDNSLSLTLVNAWNEWAEGACLEPERLHGYEYLHAVRDARLHYALDKQCLSWSQVHTKCIAAHIYYDEAVERVANRMKMYSDHCDLYITTHPKGLCVRAAKIYSILPNARILVTENRGRDVRPFLELLNTFQDLDFDYSYICKIHGKISEHRRDGVDWFDNVVEKLLPTQQNEREYLLSFLNNQAHDTFGLMAPAGHVISFNEYLGGNQIWTKMLQSYLAFNKPVTVPNLFVAGTMFWAGRTICKKLVNHFTVDRFDEEDGQLDETLAHAYERVFLWYAEHLGLRSYFSNYQMLDYSDSGQIRYRYC